jgi:hypothetical protein
VEKVTTDHWSLLSELLGEEQPEEGTGVKRFVSFLLFLFFIFFLLSYPGGWS